MHIQLYLMKAVLMTVSVRLYPTVRLPEEKIIIICPGKRNPHLNRNL